MDVVRDYIYMRPGFEHTRAAVKERIQTKDNMFSYMVLAVRSNGLRRWRSLYHGLDTPSEATFIAILGLMGTLWRAQRGDEEQLNTLLDYYSPKYTMPTSDVWTYKPVFVKTLQKQGRISQECCDEYLQSQVEVHAVPAQTPPSTTGTSEQTSWSSWLGFGSSPPAPSAAEAATPPPAEKLPDWDNLLASGLK